MNTGVGCRIFEIDETNGEEDRTSFQIAKHRHTPMATVDNVAVVAVASAAAAQVANAHYVKSHRRNRSANGIWDS